MLGCRYSYEYRTSTSTSTRDECIDIGIGLVRAESSYFQCRAYLYMARNLIGTDSSGLSDPFARIVIRNRVMRTRTATATLNPIWDQTCVLESLQFYMSPEMLKERAAPVVVELFDFDDMLDFNFLGRTLVFPYVVTFANKEYMPPKLEWWTIYRNQKRAGQLLAAVELIEVCHCLLLLLCLYSLPREQSLYYSILHFILRYSTSASSA